MANAIDIRFDQSGRQFISLDLHGTPSGRVVVSDFDITDDILDFASGAIAPDQLIFSETTIDGQAGTLISFDFDDDGVVQGDESGHAELFLVGVTAAQIETYRNSADGAFEGAQWFQNPSTDTDSAGYAINAFFYDHLSAAEGYQAAPFILTASSDGFSYATNAGGTVTVHGRDLVFDKDPTVFQDAKIVSGVLYKGVSVDANGDPVIELPLPRYPDDAQYLLDAVSDFFTLQVKYTAEGASSYEDFYSHPDYADAATLFFEMLETPGLELEDASSLSRLGGLFLDDNGYYTGVTLNGNDYNDVLIGSDYNDRIAGYEGSDVLTGNGGADVFVFEEFYGSAIPTEDSLVFSSPNDVDRITDFSIQEGDWIDFTRLFKSGQGTTAPLTDTNISIVNEDYDSDGVVDTVIRVTDAQHWDQTIANGDFTIVLEDVEYSYGEVADAIIVDPSATVGWFDASAWTVD